MMGDKSKIEWLDGGASWNPITGCTPISEGCANCYAKTMAETRLRGMFGYDKEDPFKVTFHEDKLDQPLKWKKPRKVFVCSMGDLFHEDVPDERIDQIMSIILASYIFTNTRKHTFILLTKRAERMRHYFRYREPMEMFKTWINICPIFSGDVSITFSELVKDAVYGSWYKTDSGYINKLWPLPNLWLGVTAENQRTADERIPILLSTPAAKRFVSVEPMLEAMNLTCFIPPIAMMPPDKAPETWEEWNSLNLWPDWVPQRVRDLIEKFWVESFHGGPQEWLRDSICQRSAPCGAKMTHTDCLGKDKVVTGRFIHTWNNMCMLIDDQGEHNVASTPSRNIFDPGPPSSSYQLLDWVICGAETGQNARPMNLDWARDLRDQCKAGDVPFFFKKAGPNNTPIPDDLMIREYPDYEQQI